MKDEEIVKGVTDREVDELYGCTTFELAFDKLFKELAGKHAKAVLEDYIKTHPPYPALVVKDPPTIIYRRDESSDFFKKETKNGITSWFKNDKPISYEEYEKEVDEFMKNHSAKNDKVTTTYAGNFGYTSPQTYADIPSIGVSTTPEFGGKDHISEGVRKSMEETTKPKEPQVDDKFGRVYSDLEGDMEKRSSAKNEARETCCKEPKNQPKFNIDDEVFYINQHGEIQKDTIIRVTTDDYGDNTVYFRYSTPMIFDENLPEERLYKSEFDLIKDLKHAI